MTEYKTLAEAIGHALHSLNAGGVPVVLRRPATGLESLKEIRLRWEYGPACGGAVPPPPRPWGDSNRGKLIIEERKHLTGAFTEWEPRDHDAEMFTLADIYNDCFHQPMPWAVIHVHHQVQDGYPCAGCLAEENLMAPRKHDPACIVGKMWPAGKRSGCR